MAAKIPIFISRKQTHDQKKERKKGRKKEKKNTFLKEFLNYKIWLIVEKNEYFHICWNIIWRKKYSVQTHIPRNANKHENDLFVFFFSAKDAYLYKNWYLGNYKKEV